MVSSPTGKPNQSAVIARFSRNFREEEPNAWLFNTITEAQATAADEWLIDYNEYLPYESLGDVPPVQFNPRVFNGSLYLWAVNLTGELTS